MNRRFDPRRIMLTLTGSFGAPQSCGFLAASVGRMVTRPAALPERLEEYEIGDSRRVGFFV